MKRGAPQGQASGCPTRQRTAAISNDERGGNLRLPVKGMADKNAHLYLWTINRYIEDAYRVARAWGFARARCWYGQRHRRESHSGNIRHRYGVLPVCATGTLAAHHREESNWWHWKGPHSKKPEAFQTMVSRYHPAHAGTLRPPQTAGWAVWGQQSGKRYLYAEHRRVERRPACRASDSNTGLACID